MPTTQPVAGVLTAIGAWSARESVDANPTFVRPYLVVEVTEEAEAQQAAVDAEPLGEIVNVHDEVREAEAKRCEPSNTQHVAWLLADRRAHGGDGLTLTGAVPEVVDDFWHEVRLGRGGIEREQERSISARTV
jgi:hypothetical protein